MEREELANRIYDLVCGNLDLENYPVPESSFVEDEFDPGGFCADAYDTALAAYSRLCVRLGVAD